MILTRKNNGIFSSRKQHIVVIIRGHIREGFSNDKLRNFVNFLMKHYNVRIFIHTWSEVNGSKSWKETPNLGVSNHQDSTQVTPKMIQDYFTNITLSRIVIENDKNLKLIGSVEGQLAKSCCPKIAWKNMWAGKYNMFSQMKNEMNPELTTIEFRFDLFCHSNSCHSNFSEYSVYERCSNLSTFFKEYKPRCLSTDFTCGLDNLMIGSFQQLTTLITYFHTKLSVVLAMYPNTEYQEFLVFHMIDVLFKAPPPQITESESHQNRILEHTVTRSKQMNAFITKKKRF